MANDLKLLLQSKIKNNILPALSLVSSSLKQNRKQRFFSFRETSNEKTREQTIKLDLSNLQDYEYKTKRQQQQQINKSRIHLSERSNQLSPNHKDYQYHPFIDTSRAKKENIKLVMYFEENQFIYQEIVRKRDVEKIILLFQLPMQIVQESHQFHLFTEMVVYIAQFMLDSDQLSKSVFFLKNALTLTELSRNYLLKIRIVFYLFQIMLKNYKQAIILLEKALTYAWANQYPEEEIQIYDIMGLCYFYSGEIEKADFYHTKWADGSIEPSSSYYRRTSIDFISMYERTLPIQVTQFKSMLSGYLSLPFQNLSDSNRNKFDNNKIVKYSNCQSQNILDEILNGLEFTEFHMEHHESTVSKPRQFKRATLPRRIREISQKYQKNEDKYRFSHQIYQNPLYRISLQQFVDFRKKQTFPLEKMEQTIKKNMASLVEPFKKQAQIYVKHTSQTYRENNQQFLVKNQNLLLKLLDL